jgi:hypothetical protein
MPSDLVAKIEADAEAAGLSISEVLADIAADYYGEPKPSEVLPRPKAWAIRQEQQLQLTA